MYPSAQVSPATPPSVEVVIEVPRGGFIKRGSAGDFDFWSPFPCPYNYGCVPQFIGGEGDLLDAVVLGPRLSPGSVVLVNAYGAVGLSERFMYDDKLICSTTPINDGEKQRVLRFFKVYAFCKGLLNVARGQSGPARCEGWGDARAAISRATPVDDREHHPRIGF